MSHLVRPFQWDDLTYLAEHMRKEDVEECAACGFTPLNALVHSVGQSIICKTILAPDTLLPGAIMGVCPSTSPSFGVVWLLGTEDIVRHRFIFLRRSKQVVADLFEASGREVLHNNTFIRNRVHHAWLRWLGFTFIRKVTLSEHEFYEFAKIKG